MEIRRLSNSYKNIYDDPGQVKRKNFTNELRRNKKIAAIECRRGMSSTLNEVHMTDLPRFLAEQPNLTDVEKLMLCKDLLYSAERKYEVLKYLSENLAMLKDEFISMLVDGGFVETLSKFLDLKEVEECLRESSALICGITSGPHEYIKILIENDIIYKLFMLISHYSVEISANAIWGLSNIMVDKKEYWEYIFDNKFLQNLKIFSNKLSSSNLTGKNCLIKALRSASLHIENLFFEDVNLCFEILLKVNKKGFIWSSLKVLGNLILADNGVDLFFCYGFIDNFLAALEKNEEILKDAFGVLSNLKIVSLDHAQYLISHRFPEKLLEIILRPTDVLPKALRSLDDFLYNSPSFSKYFLSAEFISLITSHLLNHSEKTRLESSYLLLDILCDSPDYNSHLFVSANTHSSILQGLMFPDPEYLKNLLLSLKILIKLISGNYVNGDCWISNLYKLEFHVNLEIKQLTSDLISSLSS